MFGHIDTDAETRPTHEPLDGEFEFDDVPLKFGEFAFGTTTVRAEYRRNRWGDLELGELVLSDPVGGGEPLVLPEPDGRREDCLTRLWFGLEPDLLGRIENRISRERL